MADLALERGALRLEVETDPLAITLRRDGRRLLRGLHVWCCDGEVHDRFIRATEGVIAREALSFAERPASVDVVERDDAGITLDLVLRTRAARRGCASRSSRAHEAVLELGADGRAAAHRRWSGTGARASASPGSAPATRQQVDHAGRAIQLGADRAYTGPDCPPDMLELGGIPQGDYAPGAVAAVQPRLRAVVRHARQRDALRARRARARERRARAAARCGCTSSADRDARRAPAPLPARAPACRRC